MEVAIFLEPEIREHLRIIEKNNKKVEHNIKLVSTHIPGRYTCMLESSLIKENKEHEKIPGQLHISAEVLGNMVR